MKKLLFLLFFFPWLAFAQNVVVTVGTGNTAASGGNPGGMIITQPVGTCTGCVSLPVTTTSSVPAARNFPGCTVGNTDTVCLAAATAQSFIQVQNVSATSTVNIACAWGATAVLNNKLDVQLAQGQSASWGPNTGGIPNEALHCIASSASTPMYLEWN
jgi:hypothetical protein